MASTVWRLLALAGLGLAVACGAAAQETKAAKIDPARGQQVVGQVCVACHGADGNSTISANPKLAGQHAEYLYKQLVEYSAKPGGQALARENPIMSGFAGALSDEDKRNVAAYFAAQQPKPGTAKVKETLDLAQRVYRTGISEKAVPACAGCHGPSGAGIPAQYPRLGGQHAEYTEVQLKAFRDGIRRNNDAMQQIAGRLSDGEIKALADYIAGLR